MWFGWNTVTIITAEVFDELTCRKRINVIANKSWSIAVHRMAITESIEHDLCSDIRMLDRGKKDILQISYSLCPLGQVNPSNFWKRERVK